MAVASPSSVQVSPSKMPVDATVPSSPVSDIKGEKEASNNKVSWTDRIPGVRVWKNLEQAYGLKFLIMLSLVTHFCKGFCRTQYGESVRYLLQAYNIPGPQIDVLSSVCDIPWAMKPLIAVTSDMFPIFGYRKNPYVVITAILGTIGLCVTCFFPVSILPKEIAVMGLFFGNVSWMTADILAEGIYSRKMADNPSTGPDLVVFVWMGQQVTGLISSVLGGYVITNWDGFLGFTGAQWCTAFCIIPTALIIYPALANFFGEKRVSREEAIEDRKKIWQQKALVLLSLMIGASSIIFAVAGMFMTVNQNFVFCVSLLVGVVTLCWTFLRPIVGRLIIFQCLVALSNLAIGGPSQYFFTDSDKQYPEGPHFGPQFFVTVCGIVSSGAALIALAIYSKFDNARYRTVYIMFILLNALLSVPNSILYSRLNVKWHISDYVFMTGETVIQSAIAMLYFMPGFLILSRVCPKKVEATLFSILASTSNFAQTVSSPVSGYICSALSINPDGSLNESAQFTNMWIANLIMVGIKLLPIAFLFLIPNNRMTEVILAPNDTYSATVGSPYQKCSGNLEHPPSDADEEEKPANVDGSSATEVATEMQPTRPTTPSQASI